MDRITGLGDSKTEFNGLGGIAKPHPKSCRPQFLPALLKFGHRCDGTGAVPGRQSHEKAVRRRARAAFFMRGFLSQLKFGRTSGTLGAAQQGTMRFTRRRPFFAARVHEGAPRSPCALVLARPHPQTAAQDRSDTVARRRAPLPWRARDGTRQVTCASLRAVHRSLASAAILDYTTASTSG